LPVPGGPHRMTDDSRSASINLRNGAPCAIKCSWKMRIGGWMRCQIGRGNWSIYSHNSDSWLILPECKRIADSWWQFHQIIKGDLQVLVVMELRRTSSRHIGSLVRLVTPVGIQLKAYLVLTKLTIQTSFRSTSLKFSSSQINYQT
jgi:hypothetical protein